MSAASAATATEGPPVTTPTPAGTDGGGAADTGAAGSGATGIGTTSSGTTTSAKRRRLEHIDAMRPLKQTGVVGTHTLLFFAPAAALAVGGSLMLLHVTREAFLFVSACMLTYSYRELQWTAVGRFWWRRCISVALPYLCWTVIYFWVTLPGASWSAPVPALEHFGSLLGSGYYQLYYLLVIMQFYVLFPFLLPLLRRCRGHHVALLATSLFLQLFWVSLMHWNVLPGPMRGYWASREITSYQFYLLAGAIAALHLDDFHRWLIEHKRLVWTGTLLTAVVAEVWYVLAAHHVFGFLGSSSDPFQPIVIPFNIGAIACIYLVGVWLVEPGRSARLRAAVRSGSDNSYGIYLAQLVFILALSALGWKQIGAAVPWPLWALLTLAIVVACCVLLTAVLARTPLSVALTGRRRASWSTFLPAGLRHGGRQPAPTTGAEIGDVGPTPPVDVGPVPDPPVSAAGTG